MTCVAECPADQRHQTVMITLRAEAQGDHGYKPPLAELEETVLLWLTCLNLQGQVRYDFTLQVQHWRIPSRSEFTGVRIICQPQFNLAGVELRVRPSGEFHQWKCILACSSERVAASIVDRARPEARAYVRRQLDAMAPAGQLPIRCSADIAERRSLKSAPKRCPVAQRVRGFRNREVRRQLCYDLQGSITLGWIELEAIRQHLVRVDRLSRNSEVLDRVVVDLVEDGILDPHSEPGKFVPTFLFEELCEARAHEIEEENKRRLRNRLTSKQKLLNAAIRDCERALSQAMEFEARAKTLAAEVVAIKTELNSVISQSSSSVI